VRGSAGRLVLGRLVSGTAVVVAVVALTWLTVYALRPNIISDGSSVVGQLSGYLERAFLHFDLGVTIRPGSPSVADVLRAGVGADLSLLVGGVVVGVTIGVVGGALAALQPRSPAARAAEVVALFAFAGPVYVVGLGLLLLFGAEIAAVPLPVGIPLSYVEWGESPARWFGALLIPWLVLGLPLGGLCFRVMAQTTVQALGEPYLQTARAKGLGRGRVVLRHAAPSGLVPTLTLAGAATSTTLLNLVLLEPVFSVPGSLRAFSVVVGTTDVHLLLGLVLEIAALVVVMNLLVDLALYVLDPRVR
jgi:peptide/nickel transport system permease protein